MSNELDASIKFDTSNYKAGITEVNRQITILTTGFKAQAAAMGDWSSTATGLEARNKTLEEVIEKQRQKVDGLQKVYGELASSGKASKKELDLLQIRINKETEALNKNEAELKDNKSALENTGKEVKELGSQTEKTEKKTRSFKGAISALKTGLKTMVIGVTAAATAVVGLTAGLLTTVDPASDLSETVSKVGVVFGENSDEVIEFGESAALALGMSENAALSAAGTYGNLFTSMGMGSDISADMSTSLITLAGDLASFNNLETTDVLEKLRAGLTGEAEPLKTLGVNINDTLIKQKAMALGLYDGKGALDASAKAQAAYALIMEQTSNAQGDFARTSGGLANQKRILTAQVENLKAKLGTALLPAITSVTSGMNELLGDPVIQNGITVLSEGIGDIAGNAQGLVGQIFSLISGGGDIGTIATGLGATLGQGISGIATKIPGVLNIGLTILKGVITGITSNIGTLIPAVIEIIKAFVNFVVDAAPTLAQAAIQIITTLVKEITKLLPQLLVAAVQIIVVLAMGIAQALPELIPTVLGIIPQIILILIQNLPLLLDAALQIIIALTQGLIASLPVLLPQIPLIIDAIYYSLLESLPIITDAAVELIVTLVNGIIENIPLIIETGKELFDAFGKWFTNNETTIWSLGEDIVNGIWAGIENNVNWFYGQVSDFFGGIVDSVKETLGIESPSKVFAGIGGNMARGLGVGFADQIDKVKREIQQSMGGMSLALNASGISAGGSSTVNNSSQTQNFYAPVIYQYGSGSKNTSKTRRW